MIFTGSGLVDKDLSLFDHGDQPFINIRDAVLIPFEEGQNLRIKRVLH